MASQLQSFNTVLLKVIRDLIIAGVLALAAAYLVLILNWENKKENFFCVENRVISDNHISFTLKCNYKCFKKLSLSCNFNNQIDTFSFTSPHFEINQVASSFFNERKGFFVTFNEDCQIVNNQNLVFDVLFSKQVVIPTNGFIVEVAGDTDYEILTVNIFATRSFHKFLSDNIYLVVLTFISFFGLTFFISKYIEVRLKLNNLRLIIQLYNDQESDKKECIIPFVFSRYVRKEKPKRATLSLIDIFLNKRELIMILRRIYIREAIMYHRSFLYQRFLNWVAVMV